MVLLSVPTSQVSYQLAAGQLLNVASSREERLRRHWPQEPSGNSFFLRLFGAAVFDAMWMLLLIGATHSGTQEVRTLTFSRAGLSYGLDTPRPENYGASHLCRLG